MKTAIITCRPDHASMNIRDRLLELYDWCEHGTYDGNPLFHVGDTFLYLSEKDSINCEGIDKEIDADLFIFATRHQSKDGKPSLSVHAPGNWGEAKYGGSPGKLCTAAANHIRAAFKLLLEHENDTHTVTVEATHHGPLIEKPCMFIEIGSAMEHWQDEALGMVIAKTIMKIALEPVEECSTVMVLGGGHYNQAANRILKETSYSVGHIAAKYALEDIDEQMIRQALAKHDSEVEMVILDWKGMGKEKQRIVSILEEMGVRYERLKNLK